MYLAEDIYRPNLPFGILLGGNTFLLQSHKVLDLQAYKI